MIVAVAVVSVLVSHCSMVVSLAPVCVFSLAHWQPVFKVTDSVMDVAASTVLQNSCDCSLLQWMVAAVLYV